MKKCSLFLIVAVLVFCSTSLFAQSEKLSSNDETPWLKGVTLDKVPDFLSPILPLKIYMDNGEPIPATFTEDIPIVMVADTTIFDPEPLSEYNGEEIPNPKWTKKPAVSWFFIDTELNKTTAASTSLQLALNQMVVTPLNPTDKGAITCYVGRRMRYDLPSGKGKSTFVNASIGKIVRVLDITPPTCGLEVSVEGIGSAIFWVAENPPNKFPLPKLADVYLNGALVNPADPEEVVTIQALELGSDMIITPEQVAITVPADAVINIKVNGGDNYKLDNEKLKFGICSGAGGEPSTVSEVNASEIDLSKLKIPESPYFYVDASDAAGNRQVLFVPIKIQ